MSDLSSLSELARFAAQPVHVDYGRRRRALRALTAQIEAQGQRRTVTDLLGVVMALSARTRRVVLPPVSIDLDVFDPDGGRAVRLTLPGT